VASVPEGLPVVATTTMSLGLRRMEKSGILVRQVGAVETLGAVQTLCLDKTGTLTQNRLSVSAMAIGTDPITEPDAATAAAGGGRGAQQRCHGRGRARHWAPRRRSARCSISRWPPGLMSGLGRKAERVAVQERSVERPWMATRHTGRRRR
jgi:Ca2+-transporting ATPase